MKIDPGKILKELRELANLSIKSVFYKWKSINTRQVEDFNHLVAGLAEKAEYAASGEIVWDVFSETLVAISNWLDSLHIIPEPEETTELIIDWNQQFKSYVAPYPEEIKIPFEEDFWVVRSTDSTWTRLYKKLHPKKKAMAANPEKPDQKSSSRRIVLHELLKRYFELPVDEFIETEKQLYLKTVSGQIKKIHTQLAKVKSALLDTGEPRLKSTAEARAFIKSCNKTIGDFQRFIGEMNGWKEYESQMDDRFADFWQGMQREFKSAWNTAGTFMLPLRKYGTDRNVKLRSDFDKRRLKSKQEWYAYFDAVLQNLKKDIEISLVQLRMASACLRTVQNIKSGISEKIRPNFARIIREIDQSSDKIKKVQASNEYKKMFLQERSNLQGIIRERELPQLIDALVSSQIDKQLEEYGLALGETTTLIGERHRLLQLENSSNGQLPKSRSVLFDTRQVIRQNISDEICETLTTYSGSLSADLEKLMRSISDVDHVIHFHFEEAARLLGQNRNGKLNKEASITTLDGMKLAQEQLHRLEAESTRLEEQSEEQLLQSTRRFIRELQDSTDNEQLFNLAMRSKAIRKAPAANNIRQEIDKLLGSIVPETDKYFNALSGKARRISRQFIHPEEIEPTAGQKEQAVELLSGMEKRIGRVPFVYQRLFNLFPLNDERFFCGRKTELEALQKQFSTWLNKNRNMVAVLAEPGSGLSSYYNLAANNIKDKAGVVHIRFEKRIGDIKQLINQIAKKMDIEPVDSLTELREKIRNTSARRACLVEGCEFLYIRQIHGLELMRQFLNLAMETSEQVFWALAFNPASWSYLDKTLAVGKIVPNRIRLKPFSDEEIRTILATRHRLSGFQVQFELGETFTGTPDVERLPNESEKQLLLQQLFFDQMRKIANGNPEASILFWLSSISAIDEDKVHLKVEKYDPALLLQPLNPENHMIIKLINQHTGLSRSELCRLLGLQSRLCEKYLNNLWMQGLIKEEAEQLTIHPFMLSAVHNLH